MMRFINTNTFKNIAFCILVCFTGCQTTKIEYVDNNKLPVNEKYRITKAYLKNGSVIEFDVQPEFKPKYKGVVNVIVYDEYGVSKFLQLGDIQKMKIEIYKENQGLTAVVILGGVVLFLVVLTFIAFRIQGIGAH